MRFFSLLPLAILALALFFSACKSDTSAPGAVSGDSSTAFAQNLLKALAAKDESKLKSLFYQKEELKEQLKYQMLTSGREVLPEDQLEARAADMWSAMESNEGNLMAGFQRGGIEDWAEVRLDSARLAVKKPNQIPDAPQNTTQVEAMASLIGHLTVKNAPRTMVVPCMVLKNGTMRLVGFPSFRAQNDLPTNQTFDSPNQ